MIPDFPTQEKLAEITKTLAACQTLEQARDYVLKLPPLDRKLIDQVNPHDCPFLKNPDGTFKPYKGVRSDTALSVSLCEEDRDATEEDAKAVYTELFEIISTALIEAKKRGHRLLINVGELHPDPGSNVINRMALDIASHLGIYKIGIENTVHAREVKTADGRTVMRPGLKEWIAYAKSITGEDGKIAEMHETSITTGCVTQNRASFIPYAYKLAKQERDIFATDICYGQPYEEREWGMIEAIKEYIDIDQPVLHLCGEAHIHPLRKKALESIKDVYVLNLSVRQLTFLCPPFKESLFESSPELSFPTSAHHLLIKGRVNRLNQSEELANAAEKALGEKLAKQFFDKHPYMLPENSFPTQPALGGHAERAISRRGQSNVRSPG